VSRKLSPPEQKGGWNFLAEIVQLRDHWQYILFCIFE
jgi:hypothetical protein